MTDKEMKEECRRLMLDCFSGDIKKTDHWFRTRNTMLEAQSPHYLMAIGQTKKVYDFILNLVKEQATWATPDK